VRAGAILNAASQGGPKERAGNKLPACFWYIIRPD
jgi:hypothetical protein